MPENDVLSLLADSHLDDLEAALSQVRERRAEEERTETQARIRRERLDADEALLTQVIAWRRRVNGRTEGTEDGPGRDAVEPLVPVLPPRPSPKRDVIIAVMRDDPDRGGWRPRQMRDALEVRGIQATTNNMAVTMRRMRETGLLRRLEDGRYTLPPDPGAESMGVGQGSTPESG